MRRIGLARPLALAGGALVAVTVAGPGADAVAADPPRTHQVAIQALAFAPETLTVRPGDVVVWTNKDPFPHTVTAAGAFDSGSIAAGKTWRYTAGKRGNYPYLCTLHTTMKGTLRVE